MSDIKTETRPVVVGAGDGLLFGYDQDMIPMVWQEGEPPAEATEGQDYAGWWLDRYGLDVFWRDPDGKEIRP